MSIRQKKLQRVKKKKLKKKYYEDIKRPGFKVKNGNGLCVSIFEDYS